MTLTKLGEDRLCELLSAIDDAKFVFVRIRGMHNSVTARITKQEAIGIATHIIADGVEWHYDDGELHFG